MVLSLLGAWWSEEGVQDLFFLTPSYRFSLVTKIKILCDVLMTKIIIHNLYQPDSPNAVFPRLADVIPT